MKKINRDTPEHPVILETFDEAHHNNVTASNYAEGYSKRERAALQLLVALCSSSAYGHWRHTDLALRAVEMADALFDELEA